MCYLCFSFCINMIQIRQKVQLTCALFLSREGGDFSGCLSFFFFFWCWREVELSDAIDDIGLAETLRCLTLPGLTNGVSSGSLIQWNFNYSKSIYRKVKYIWTLSTGWDMFQKTELLLLLNVIKYLLLNSYS